MILLVSSVFPPEPVVSASLASDIAEALSKTTEVKVLTPRPSRPMGFSYIKTYEKRSDFEHIIVASFIYPKSKILGRMYESYSFGKHAVKYIEKNKTRIKCIYIHAWPLLAQYLIAKASKRYSIPFLFISWIFILKLY